MRSNALTVDLIAGHGPLLQVSLAPAVTMSLSVSKASEEKDVQDEEAENGGQVVPAEQEASESLADDAETAFVAEASQDGVVITPDQVEQSESQLAGVVDDSLEADPILEGSAETLTEGAAASSDIGVEGADVIAGEGELELSDLLALFFF